ncbi:uncharacterized protein LOC143808980 [Ranitomeya variabilis]|uniref:uncharacterized protein LOC143808980 n=1 Tax=Ranitomeya variabilis TaxID=490064 RepID=UPI00405647CB
MKDRFNKDLCQESRAASGSGARIRLYKYHRVLSFLRPVLAQRATHSTTVEPGSGAVLQPAATDPSQPSSSTAAGGLHYSANTMTSAVGHPTATTVTTAAPAWTSSTDTTMQQDPGVAFRPGPTTMQQDPGVAFRPGPTTMQQDPGGSFRPGPTTMQQVPGVALCFPPNTTHQDSGMGERSTSAMDCETVQPDPVGSPATTLQHMSPPRRPPTRQTPKKNQKKKPTSYSSPSPTDVSVLSVLSHPSSVSQASHVSSPIPELPDPSSFIAPSPASSASSTVSQASVLHTPRLHHLTPSRRGSKK